MQSLQNKVTYALTPAPSFSHAGYRADANLRTWPDFQYASAAERRGAAAGFGRDIFERSLAEQEV